MKEMKALRVLHLEDSPLDAELVHSALSGSSVECEIFRAQTRADFAAALESGDFDLILADYSHPTFGGLSALKAAQEICPEAPFVLVSGAVGEERAIEALKSGAEDYVLKQRLERLVPAVQRALQEAQERNKRKRAEEALQYQLGLTRTITDNAAESLFLCDTEGRVTFMNPAAEETFGWRREELLGEVLHDRMHHHHPDGRPYPMSECPLVKVFESGRTLRDHEDVFFRRDGSAVDVACSHAPIVVDGRITGAVLVVRDITDRKRVEKALREQTETLEKVNHIGRLLSSELDLQRLVQAVTDKATQLTGARFGAFFYNLVDDRGESYTLYTISGAPREAFSKFPMPRNTEVFGPTFKGEGVVRANDIREDPRYGTNPPYNGMPKGHLPVVSYLAVPVISRSGEVLGGLFFGHPEADVFGEREEQIAVVLAAQAAIAVDNARLFESMRESEDRLSLAVESTGLGTWDFDPSSGELRWDERCKAMFGLSPEAEVDHETFLAGLHPEDREWTDRAVQHALDPASGGGFDLEYRTVGIEDGVERWVSARGQAFFDEGRRAVRFTGTVLDITERKRAEEALRQSELLYRTVMKQATENIFLIDTEARGMVEFNPTVREALGYPEKEPR